MDKSLTGTPNEGQSEPRINGNEKVLAFPQAPRLKPHPQDTH